MDISLLLAGVAGKGQALSGKPTQGDGGFSLALERLGAAGAPVAPGQAGTQLPGASAKGLAASPLAALEIDLPQGRLDAMMQALGELPAEGVDARLAEIAERLALIQAAGQQAETPPTAEAAMPSTEALHAALPAPAANVSPEGEPEMAAAGEWAALAVAAQPGVDEASRGLRHGEAAADGKAPPRLSAMEPPALAQAERLDARAGAAARPAAEGAAPRAAEPAISALPPRPDGQLSASEGRGSEPRGEGFATLLNGQPGSLASPAAGAGPNAAALSAPLNSPAWPQQFSQQVGQQMMMLGQRGGEQRIELHLNPAELGPLTISLKMSEQAAQAQFLSAHASVRGAVEQAIPQLREALAEQGISLGDTSVGEQRQDDTGGELAGQGGTGTRGSDAAPGEEGEALAASVAASPADISLDGRVDLYA
ncbi:flagellar hook-length control protein FliK [Halomonas campaniensis]|uniref:flagellar hook-length control protein FliK n=1 Tax=Halomonas campaniensis TaxID=213554 RepID=UPI003970B934